MVSSMPSFFVKRLWPEFADKQTNRRASFRTFYLSNGKENFCSLCFCMTMCSMCDNVHVKMSDHMGVSSEQGYVEFIYYESMFFVV